MKNETTEVKKVPYTIVASEVANIIKKHFKWCTLYIGVHDICSPRTFVPQMSHRDHIASMSSKLSGIIALIYGYIHINLGSNTRSVVPSRHLGNKCPWGTNIMNPIY